MSIVKRLGGCCCYVLYRYLKPSSIGVSIYTIEAILKKRLSLPLNYVLLGKPSLFGVTLTKRLPPVVFCPDAIGSVLLSAYPLLPNITNEFVSFGLLYWPPLSAFIVPYECITLLFDWLVLPLQ